MCHSPLPQLSLSEGSRGRPLQRQPQPAIHRGWKKCVFSVFRFSRLPMAQKHFFFLMEKIPTCG